MSQDPLIHSENSQLPPAPRPGWSCSSCLFALFMSYCFVQLGLFFAVPFVYLEAPANYALVAGGIFVFGFLWQLRATKRGCFMPFFILAAFLVSESLVLSVLVYDTGAYQKIDFSKAKPFLDTHAPGLYESARKTFQAAAEQGRQLYDSARSFHQSDETGIAALEEAFQRHPGSPDVALALADAYMAQNDLASIRLATALYEALVETAPCDTFLARLADAYARTLRFDLAFATAARRTWLPYASYGKAARQLAYLAACSGDLSRGIFELERILRLNPAESEEVMLLLAGLYSDAGNKQQARALLDRVIAAAPAALSVTRTAVSMKQAIGN